MSASPHPSYVLLHHIESGPVELISIDANHALSFPREWSREPWSEEAKAAWAEQKKAEREAAEAEQIAKFRDEFVLKEKARILAEADLEAMKERAKAEIAAEAAASKKK